MKNKIITIVMFLTIVLLCITGCGTSKSGEENNAKLIEELDYLDTQIVSIANKLNNLTLSNYIITSEEIQRGEKNSNNSSGGSDGQQEETGNEQNKSDSQNTKDSETDKTNITVTSMEPNNVVDVSETNIDWKTIKNEIEILNQAWPVIVIDLTNANIDNNDIINFSNLINEILINAKNENKQETIKKIANLYSIIPKFEEKINVNSGEKNIKLSKAYLINAYSMLEENNWQEIETNISSLDSSFKNVVNDMDYIKNKEFKVNRAYVLLKELQNSLVNRDKNLFLVKYSNLMESLNTL